MPSAIAAGRTVGVVTSFTAALIGSTVSAQDSSMDASRDPSAAELAAAFPDLGGMEARYMMIEDPFETLVLIDRLEWQDADGDPLSWNLKAWAGKDINKLILRSEGERESGRTADADVELLWGRAVGAWWDLVAGLRHDLEPGPSRSWAAFGVQGVAPYEFEIAATAYVGEGGRASLRLEAEYELLITQRVILQPLVEADWYSEDDVERGIGSGLSTLEIGLRLRYEIRRELAPYVGIVHLRRFGDTADLARLAGSDPQDTRLTIGLRAWF